MSCTTALLTRGDKGYLGHRERSVRVRLTGCRNQPAGVPVLQETTKADYFFSRVGCSTEHDRASLASLRGLVDGHGALVGGNPGVVLSLSHGEMGRGSPDHPHRCISGSPLLCSSGCKEGIHRVFLLSVGRQRGARAATDSTKGTFLSVLWKHQVYRRSK